MLRDPLQRYREKRDFSKTAEPSGAKRAAAKQRGKLKFIIQKHAASHLHYDFRIEHNGVMLSWACPKGPSLNPQDKRLAVHVEDHPLDYNTFEGTIPKGEYGGGTVMLWDRGTWEPHGDVDEGLRKGKLAFDLHGERLHGGWALVRLRGRPSDRGRDNWLLIKEQDSEAKTRGKPIVETEIISVASGRTMDEIAGSKKVWHSNRSKGKAKTSRSSSPGRRAAVRPGDPSSQRKMDRRIKSGDDEGKAKRRGHKAHSSSDNETAEFAGVRITHADRVLFAGQGVTKRALAEYYLSVADVMLPHVTGRPLALVRCPQGSGKECFFQKHANPGWPDAFKKVRIKEKSGSADYLYIEDERGLMAAVQMGVLELHVWGSRVDRVEQPDRMVFDFDPDEDLAFAEVKQAARDMRARLDALGLKSFPMATGGKGIHVVVPFTRRHDWDEHRAFAEALARVMAEEEPERFVANMSKAKRKGKIFIDYLRNQRGATAIAPYSSRARPGAHVAFPVSWEALGRLKDAHPVSTADAAKKLARAKDPWAGYAKVRQVLPLSKLKAKIGL